MANYESSDKEMDLVKKVKDLETELSFYKSILDSIPFDIYSRNRNLEFDYVNKKAAENLNLSKNQIIGKNYTEIWTESPMYNTFRHADENLLNGKDIFRTVAPFLNHDFIKYAEYVKAPVKNQNNEITGILDIVISPEEKSEQKIKASESILIFDYLLHEQKFLLIKGLKGFEFFNQPELNYSKIMRAGVIKPEDMDLLNLAYKQIISGVDSVHFIMDIKDSSGQYIPCNININCLYNQLKKPVRLSGTLSVIKNDKLVDEKIKLDVSISKQQFHSIIENSYDLYLYVNPELNFYKIIHADHSFVRIPTEGNWNQLIDDLYDRLHPLDYGILKNIFLAVQTFGNNDYDPNIKREFRFADLNGDFRWKSFSVDKLAYKKTSGMLLSFFDVDAAVKEREERTYKLLNGDLIDVLSTVVEFRDMESGEHIQRIKTFTKILLHNANKVYEDLSLSSAEIDIISTASAMHDIGKIAIPDNILLKPGKYTPEEFNIMKEHTTKGCEILKSMPKIQSEEYYKYSYEICRHHHERWDGRGYPDGLKGDEIPLESQIVSLADVYDALISKRCYKEAFGFDEAYKMIVNGECGVFSPKLMKCFELSVQEMEKFARSFM